MPDWAERQDLAHAADQIGILFENAQRGAEACRQMELIVTEHDRVRRHHMFRSEVQTCGKRRLLVQIGHPTMIVDRGPDSVVKWSGRTINNDQVSRTRCPIMNLSKQVILSIPGGHYDGKKRQIDIKTPRTGA